ncbi:hypothetical protein D3C73_1014040 [compost metagenome]
MRPGGSGLDEVQFLDSAVTGKGINDSGHHPSVCLRFAGGFHGVDRGANRGSDYSASQRVIGDLVDLFLGYYVGELEYRLGSKGHDLEIFRQEVTDSMHFHSVRVMSENMPVYVV